MRNHINPGIKFYDNIWRQFAGATKLCYCGFKYLQIYSIVFTSFSPSGTFIFEVASNFLQNFCTHELVFIVSISLFRIQNIGTGVPDDETYLLKTRRLRNPHITQFHRTKSYGCTCEHESQQELFHYCELQYLRVPGKLNILYTYSIYTYQC